MSTNEPSTKKHHRSLKEPPNVWKNRKMLQKVEFFWTPPTASECIWMYPNITETGLNRFKQIQMHQITCENLESRQGVISIKKSETNRTHSGKRHTYCILGVIVTDLFFFQQNMWFVGRNEQMLRSTTPGNNTRMSQGTVPPQLISDVVGGCSYLANNCPDRFLRQKLFIIAIH